MRVPGKYYDEVFNFKGQWDVPSKCGLKIVKNNGKTCIIVTELYQDNSGTSITYAGYSLFKQICENKRLSENEVIYFECNPDTNSKLSFYDEEFFEVTFPEVNGGSGRPAYRQLSADEVKSLFV
ncbi:MAG: hypothetical protein LBG96_04195 [Tannerella sp.]|jgi:hypothetical protein|nr:hypothetical protein [Tannerella sp.]